MKARPVLLQLIGASLVLFALASPAPAQITTGAVTGAVKDDQELRVPGATVAPVSESRGAATGAQALRSIQAQLRFSF